MAERERALGGHSAAKWAQPASPMFVPCREASITAGAAAGSRLAVASEIAQKNYRRFERTIVRAVGARRLMRLERISLAEGKGAWYCA